MTDDRLQQRVRALIAAAVDGLDPADRAERIAYCQAHDEHGARMYVDDGVLEFRWGGRRLALVAAADLSGTDPLLAVFGTDVPDTLPDGWAER